MLLKGIVQTAAPRGQEDLPSPGTVMPQPKEKVMKVNAGLWIDHLKAMIVITFEGGEKKLEILSHADSLPGRINGGLATDATQPLRTEEGRKRAYTVQLNRFYTEVIGAIRDAEAILIFGPGEAKEELAGHLGRARLGDKVIGVEAAERMTDPQVAARIREHFQPSLSSVGVA